MKYECFYNIVTTYRNISMTEVRYIDLLNTDILIPYVEYVIFKFTQPSRMLHAGLQLFSIYGKQYQYIDIIANIC